MKLKKILAGVSAAALAASMSCAFSASAVTLGADKVDFEDGDCSFVYMNVDDGGSDASVLSVEDYEGSKQLKVDVQDCTKIPKVWFDVDKIMPRETAVQVKQVEFDVTFVPKDSAKQLGWMGGSVGVAGGFDVNLPGKGQKNPSWSDGSWDCADENLYVDGGIAKTHITRKMLLPTQMWSEKSVNPFFGFMTWANQNDCQYTIYIDNIVFSDGSGKTFTVGLPAVEETTVEETAAETEAAPAETEAAPAETEAAPAETEAAPVETEAAPAETEAAPVETEVAPVETEAPATEAAPVETTAAPANTTTVPATGNTAAATIAAVMVVAGAAAVITKKRG